MRYSKESKFRIDVKGYGFCHLLENLVINTIKNYWILNKHRNRWCKNCL